MKRKDLKWDEDKIYKFYLKDLEAIEIELPEGYNLIRTGINEFSRENFLKILGPKRLSRFEELVGEDNDFFFVYIVKNSEIIGTTVGILEEKGKARLEWAQVKKEHRGKGLYKAMQLYCLQILKRYKAKELRFTLSEAWLLPFWLRTFGKKRNDF